ncbi:MAG: mechanosensitive ion channel [Prolixibacteraceae bacterium]|jgi:small conductance mechanosensitive channel|nr:mechanosensitive ion channel [Prolixibacteraceae bacterium]
MDEVTLTSLWDNVANFISIYGIKLIGAIIVLIVGLWVIKIITRSLNKTLSKKIDDPSLAGFIKSFASILLKIMLVISIMTMVGIQMTSFIALLAAAGLAVGMALSGMLQNFAGGVMVLIFKPFEVGNYITASGHSGTVKEIQIFNTILNTPDNRIIIIPNGKIYSESIVNYSKEATRRVDFTFGISYDDDIDKAKEILKSIIESNELILKEPAPFIALSEMADSSVNIVVRAWVEAPNYWSVFFNTNEVVFKEFNKQGINIPYPQMDVHVKNQ